MKSKALITEEDVSAWHDTNGVYIAAVIFSLAVLLFSVAGIVVAKTDPGFGPYAWVPELLAVMSLVVLVSSATRLVRRAVAVVRERRSRRGNGIPL